MNLTFTRRTFAARFASVLSALGVTAAVLPNRAVGPEFRRAGCGRNPQAE